MIFTPHGSLTNERIILIQYFYFILFKDIGKQEKEKLTIQTQSTLYIEYLHHQYSLELYNYNKYRIINYLFNFF